MDKLVLIDGNALIHRAYHAYPHLTTSKGELINAVYGFTSILLTVLQQLRPKYVAVTFDKKAPTFRHKEFKAYKAHRPKMDEELVGQIERVHEIVRVLNIPIFEVDGYEGDDVIGTLAKQAFKLLRLPVKNSLSSQSHAKSSNQQYSSSRDALKTKTKEFLLTPRNASEQLETLIVTGDYDTLQLVNEKVRVMMPPRGKIPAAVFNPQAVMDKYGFEPKYLIDFKALSGDASDGIPGVDGIGPKTASDLIKKYGILENIYKKVFSDENIKKLVKEKLKKGKKDAILSKRLATIVTNVPIKLDLSKCELSDYDRPKAINLFEELEFRTLIRKLPDDGWDDLVENRKQKTENRKDKEKKNNQLGLF